MRIISGKHKSKRINAPHNLPVRPTTDMAKEALFNILNNSYYFDQISVVDLFAGIGSISFEFASRGTENIISVDKNRGCVKFLEKTGKELDIDIQVLKSDAFTFLEKTSSKFDVIFADPPYDLPQDQFYKIAELVFERNLLNDDGMLIVEHSKFTDLSGHKAFVNSRKYGSNIFSFFKK
ncbi:MAG: 16S rRNA (guanine(966)-N(2))-methyltransferase RsmD [Flavobacteriia bacterium]|nr:MAG: 16S rRNA (guanine(966)-N(2))-methyltransferase RsmD [Flavobacteriia bacterium]